MSLESSKTMGGIGAIFVAIGSFVPFLGLVGIILVLIAMKGLAETYNDHSIFQNALYGFIFGIVGIVAAAFILAGVFFGFTIIGPTMNIADPFAFIGGIILALVVVFIFYLLNAIFYKKAFDTLASKTGEGMFGTAGLLLLVGAILTIILIGLLLIFITWILAAVAFFSIKTPATPTTTPPPPPVQ